MFLLSPAWTQEAGLTIKAEIPGIWDTIFPDIGVPDIDTVCSFSHGYGSEELVLVVECYASTFGSPDKPEGPEYGSRSDTGLTSRDFRDLGVCLCRCTTS